MRETGLKRRFYNSTTVQTLIALSFNTISLFAGGLISIFTPQFEKLPWILALFPPVLTIRGGIGGIFSGNLATMLHLGIIRSSIRRNTRVYGQLISAVFVITVIDTVAMGLFSFALNFLFGKISFVHLTIFTSVPTVACTMALAFSVPLTSVIAVTTFKKGLDPDIIVYPVLASVNDIVVTVSFVATVFLIISNGLMNLLFNALFVVIIFISLFLAWKNRGEKFFHQTLQEGISVVILSSLFGSINGVFLSNLSNSLRKYPGLVVIYPSLTNALGNIGSIVGSKTTTSLALGYVKTLKEELKGAFLTIAQVEFVALFVHMVFGIIAYTIAKLSFPYTSLSLLIGIALNTNLISFLMISLFSLAIAYLSFQRGLNPDNVVIPIITTISDTVASIAIILALFFLKYLGIAF